MCLHVTVTFMLLDVDDTILCGDLVKTDITLHEEFSAAAFFYFL